MKELIFKNIKLKPIIQKETFDMMFSDGKNLEFMNLDYRSNPEILKNKPVISSNISGSILHRNYIEYLKIAYNNDYGIEISPNHIWFTILCSFAKIIKDDADLFKKFFTKSDEKTIITLDTPADSMIEMPIGKMMNLILKELPSKVSKETIIPKVSTRTPEFELACAAAFIDTCSPYYEYTFYGCGYNKIKVLGTKKDYEKLIKSFYDLINIISDYTKHKKLYNFYNDVHNTLHKITANYDDNKFWERILWTEAGYGGQNLDGWIMPFQVYNSHYALVEYTELSSNKRYAFCTGIFSSKIENDYLIPQFEKFIVALD